MLAPLPFALHATTGCPPAAELAVSLAGAFHDVDAVAVDSSLDAIAAGIALPHGRGPAEELAAVAELAASDDPALPAAEDGEDVGGLMLDRALERGRAHPLTLAIVLAEAARRRGIPAGVVSNGTDHCVAHTKLPEPLLLVAASGAVVDAQTLAAPLQWRCAHEACALLIDAIELRWLRWSRIDLALRAAELRMHLPLDDDSVDRAGARLEHVRSNFN